MMSDPASGADLVGLISSFLPGPSTGAEESSPQTSDDVTDNVKLARDACTDWEGDIIPPARVIIFSKDRPWQLRELLRSMKLGSGCYSGRFLPRMSDVKIILRSSSAAFARGYESVMDAYPGMHFLIEDDGAEGKVFSALLDATLKEDVGESNDAPNDGIVMFLTDDCLFLEPLEDALACASGALSDECIFNFVSRLHPGISWSQTREAPSPPPRDGMKFRSLARYLSAGRDDSNCNSSEGVFVYNRRKCTGEWAYSFDLSGGVYRLTDVVALLSHMPVEDRSHPNTLEMRANQLLNDACRDADHNEQLAGLQQPLSAVPTRPLMLILAVNRVQDVFQAPLATSFDGMAGKGTVGGNTIDPSDPESLLCLLDKDCHLDVSAYENTLYNSSHIGDFVIEHELKPLEDSVSVEEAECSECIPSISVLMPVHRGPPDAARHSLLSIVMQRVQTGNNGCEQALLSQMQIVIVDDRCSDGSIDEMVRACRDLANDYPDVRFAVQDFRPEGDASKQVLNGSDGPAISLDIVQSSRAGVAAALNHGLEYCRADLVARMDADDIATPGRLSAQISFMKANPSVDVVGTSSILFSEQKAADGCSGAMLPYSNITGQEESYGLLRPSLPLSDAGFLAWAMHFTCCLVHPSVVFRKNAVRELGGYDESISRCEDYDLWLRLQNQRSRSIVCLPFVGLWHRKHSASSSSVGSKAQKREANEVCCRAIERILDSDDEDKQLLGHVATLRNPSGAQSPESLNLSAQLLQKLEASFLEKNSEHLTALELALIKLDCSERIGEIATVLATKFGLAADVSTSYAWVAWCERCPEKQLERLSLLCHAAKRAEA